MYSNKSIYFYKELILLLFKRCFNNVFTLYCSDVQTWQCVQQNAGVPTAEQQKVTQRTTSDGSPYTNVSQALSRGDQTALTAQIHKRAWLPSRLKVTPVSGIFRPSTWRLRFLIHALWNVSYTCHNDTLMQCQLHSVTSYAAVDVSVKACIVTQAASINSSIQWQTKLML